MKTSRAEVMQQLVQAIGELSTTQHESSEINDTAQLSGDLGLTSVDLIHLVMALEERFKRRLDIQELVIVDGEFVSDVQVGTLVDFICTELGIDSAA